jgi:sugar diacid utilization regulator
MSDLQGLVDSLATTLGRPVDVDDRQFRVVAYSSHLDGVDPVRLASILRRQAPDDVASWLESLGVRDVADYLRVPANPRFGMAARICIPIRFDGTLLGYLWLIDEPQPLSAVELEAALRCAEDLGVALYRVRRLEHEDRERERELLEALAGRRGGDSDAAAAELLRDGFLATAPAYAALVAQPFHANGEQPPDAVRVRLAAAAEHARRGAAPRHLLVHVSGEQVLCVLALDGAEELERRARALAAEIERNLRDSPGFSAVIGVGGACDAARELRRSHEEAQHALALGRNVERLGPLVLWSSLGAYRLLAQLRSGADTAPPLPESVRRLLASGDAASLVATLESYLDHAGDARATAEALFVHRSSLYSRLRRIEQVAGIDLRSGEDRLELHLGLRMWRMSGSLPPD